MPNWCNNVVELSHEDSKMIERAVTAFNKGDFLKEFIPVPEDLRNTQATFGESDDVKQARNREKYGYNHWYDFCINEWGTKWDVGGDDFKVELVEGDKNVSFSFDSAWAPPTNAYEKLVELGFTVTGYYYEPGMQFAGIWEDGCDDYYELGSYENSTVVAESIPEVLDDMFYISGNMAEWEEEMAEEENE